MTHGLVSVMLTVFYGEPYLKACLDSLLAQDYPNLEIIILDDIRSPSQTKEVCQDYAKRYPGKIRYILDETHRITHEASNEIFKYVSGEFCMLAGDDDLWDPTYISTLVKILREHPEIGMAYTNGYYIRGSTPAPETNIVKPERLFFANHSQSYMFRYYLKHRHVVPMIFGLFRTELYKKTLPFDCFDGTGDVDNLFMLKFFTLSKVHSLNQRLYGRRVDHEIPRVHEKPRQQTWWNYAKHQLKFVMAILSVIKNAVLSPWQKLGLTACTFSSLLWYIGPRYLIIVILWNKPVMLLIRRLVHV